MVIHSIAGKIADGAFPYTATPQGKLNTPAPTILFTKLNTSFGIVAVPVPETVVVPLPPLPPPLGISTADAAVVESDVNVGFHMALVDGATKGWEDTIRFVLRTTEAGCTANANTVGVTYT